MFGVVLTNRELSDGFAMLAGPLAHVDYNKSEAAEETEELN